MSEIVAGAFSASVPARFLMWSMYSSCASRTVFRRSAPTSIRLARTPERSDSVSAIASVFVDASSLIVRTRPLRRPTYSYVRRPVFVVRS
jgi:hypothetical protein